MKFEQKGQVSLLNWGCEKLVHHSSVSFPLPEHSDLEGHILQTVQLWMVEDLLSVWLNQCMEITHPGDLPVSAMVIT